MPDYSVAEARARLPRLIDAARCGESVVITRRGKPVAEIRPTGAGERRLPSDSERVALYRWLAARRITPGAGAPNSVELLNQIYDEP